MLLHRARQFIGTCNRATGRGSEGPTDVASTGDGPGLTQIGGLSRSAWKGDDRAVLRKRRRQLNAEIREPRPGVNPYAEAY